MFRKYEVWKWLRKQEKKSMGVRNEVLCHTESVSPFLPQRLNRKVQADQGSSLANQFGPAKVEYLQESHDF